MSMTKLYTGDDGETHLEEIDIDSILGSLPELRSLQNVKSIYLGKRDSLELPFLPEPARRLHIIISGSLEIGLGDGTKHQYKTGDLRLIEDTTGHGHSFKLLEPTTSLVIEFND